MLQDIDLKYRSGVLTSGKPLAVPALTVAGQAITGGLSTPSTPQPSDHGLIAWSGPDPAVASSTSALVSGTLYLTALFFRSAASVTKLWWIHTAAAVSATAGQNWTGLYGSNGTLLTSVGIDGVVTSNSVRSATLSSAQAVTAGTYWMALLVNASTPPTVARYGGASAAGNSMNLAAAGLRFCVNGTGLTSLPASITTASNTTTGSIALAVAAS